MKEIKCFLLDMDGTIHLSGEVLPGAAAAIERMRAQGEVFFITNNTSVSRKIYIEKLRNMGIACKERDIYTAGNATIDYLHKNYPGKKVFILGTNAFVQEVIDCGIETTEDSPDLVIIAYDTELTYEKLTKTCTFIQKGIPYLATHPDINCPTSTGFIPDVGSFLALIELSTGKKPFIICGKPATPMGDGIRGLGNWDARHIAMFGDRLSTDIALANNNGFLGVLVLTGEATRDDHERSNYKADIILKSLADWDA